MAKDVKHAVIIQPAESLWAPIQQIRKEHDKAYIRWMPHINLYVVIYKYINYCTLIILYGQKHTLDGCLTLIYRLLFYMIYYFLFFDNGVIIKRTISS